MCAFRVGQEQYLQFNGLVLTSNLASEVKMTISGKEVDVSTIGTFWQDVRQGQAKLTLNVNGVWDDGTAATSLTTVAFNNLNNGGTKLWEFAPAGSASGRPLIRGNGVINSFDVGGAVSDKVAFTMVIGNAGTPTLGTVS